MPDPSELPPEEPEELVPTEEEIAQMRAATSAEAQAVDELILSQCTERFRKVAMVAAKVLREFDGRFPHLPMPYIIARIQELEEAGVLEVAGYVWYPRHSELRLVRRQ